MFAQPFTGVMPPDGAFNAGYGVPSGGSMSRYGIRARVWGMYRFNIKYVLSIGLNTIICIPVPMVLFYPF